MCSPQIVPPPEKHEIVNHPTEMVNNQWGIIFNCVCKRIFHTTGTKSRRLGDTYLKVAANATGSIIPGIFLIITLPVTPVFRFGKEAGSLSDLGNRSENSTGRRQILSILLGNSCSIARKNGGIWTVQMDLQQIYPKSDRLLVLKGTTHQGCGYTANLNLCFHFYREKAIIIS
jgi:hypothetical protein